MSSAKLQAGSQEFATKDDAVLVKAAEVLYLKLQSLEDMLKDQPDSNQLAMMSHDSTVIGQLTETTVVKF